MLPSYARLGAEYLHLYATLTTIHCNLGKCAWGKVDGYGAYDTDILAWVQLIKITRIDTTKIV